MLLQQPNFLTGIIKVWSYLIKFLFICYGKCESFVESQSSALHLSQKLAAGFHSFCCLWTILSCPVVSVNGEWITVRWVILRGACINDAEKLKSLCLQPASGISRGERQTDKERKPETKWGVGQGQTWWDFRNLWGWWWMSEIGLSAYWKAICFH